MTLMQIPLGRPVHRGFIIAGEVLLLLLIAVLVRSAGLWEEALHDELYNFLAAQGFLGKGEFLIVEGAEPYNRGAMFTRTAAVFMKAFGSTLPVARLPALLAGSLVSVGVFLWLRLSGERAAGWLAGILVAFDPLLIQLSRIVRFYSFQHLFFLSGTICVYWLLFHRGSRTKTLVALGLSAIAFTMAVVLQPVSIIGLCGVMIFAAFVLYWSKIRLLNRELQVWIAVITNLGVSLGAFLFLATGVAAKYIELYGYADLWATQNVDNHRFYYAILYSYYAPIWSLFPLLLLLGAVRHMRLAALCAAVFGVGFIGHSLAAWKAERYLSYLIPFFFIIAGLGLVNSMAFLWLYVRRLVDAIVGPGGYERARTVMAVGFAVTVFGFAMLGNHAFLTTVRLVTRDHASNFPLMGSNDGSLSWSRAATLLKPIAENVEVVVSSDDLKAIYYLGRVDYALSPNSLYTPEGFLPEFSLDNRTNTAIVASPEAIAAIMRCHSSGLFVVQSMSLAQSATSRSAAASYVASVADLVALPEEWGIVAYRWENPPGLFNQDCLSVMPRQALDLDVVTEQRN